MGEESETSGRREYFYEDDDPLRSTTAPRRKVIIFHTRAWETLWKRCRSCGAFFVDYGFRYCPYCGKPLQEEYVLYWEVNE